MTSLVRLQDKQWAKIRDFLRNEQNAYIGNETVCRCFIEGILWINRSHAQWRLLPAEYGNWNSVYRRCDRWCEQGIWERMLNFFADDPDMENILMDCNLVSKPYKGS